MIKFSTIALGLFLTITTSGITIAAPYTDAVKQAEKLSKIIVVPKGKVLPKKNTQKYKCGELIIKNDVTQYTVQGGSDVYLSKDGHFFLKMTGKNFVKDYAKCD